MNETDALGIKQMHWAVWRGHLLKRGMRPSTIEKGEGKKKKKEKEKGEERKRSGRWGVGHK